MLLSPPEEIFSGIGLTKWLGFRINHGTFLVSSVAFALLALTCLLLFLRALLYLLGRSSRRVCIFTCSQQVSCQPFALRRHCRCCHLFLRLLSEPVFLQEPDMQLQKEEIMQLQKEAIMQQDTKEEIMKLPKEEIMKLHQQDTKEEIMQQQDTKEEIMKPNMKLHQEG